MSVEPQVVPAGTGEHPILSVAIAANDLARSAAFAHFTDPSGTTMALIGP